MGTGPVDHGELAAAWWEYQRLSEGSRPERKALELGEPAAACAAKSSVDDFIASGGVEALEVVLALLETASDSSGVGVVAAGPLEDLVHEHGNALVDELDRLAIKDPAFRQAMAGVWLSTGVLVPDTERRLQRWVAPRRSEPPRWLRRARKR